MENEKTIKQTSGSNLISSKVTICVVNYRTLDFTRLCLRSIRKFPHYPHEVIVVDNASGDESLEYLRSLDWIKLIERKGCDDDSGGTAHGRAIDVGFEQCQTEYFMSMHSDTFVLHDGWLGELMSCFEKEPAVTCLGSGKLELRPGWQLWLKQATDFKAHIRKLTGSYGENGRYRYYNRTICSVYRTEILREEGFKFLMGRKKGYAPGKQLYYDLVDNGYETVEMPPSKMSKFVTHLAHATTPVIVKDTARRRRTERKFQRRLNKVWQASTIQELLADDSLDK
jgi:hypothetical protein